MTPSGKTMDGTQKSVGVKWWHGPFLSSCKIWWKPNDTCRRERMKFVFLLFFLNNAVGRRPLWCIVELLPQDIASAFAGRFKWGLQRFFVEEKPLPAYGTVFKIVARWRCDWCPNGRKKFKIWENGCKVCAHHFDHLEARWKNISTTAFYLMSCRCAVV